MRQLQPAPREGQRTLAPIPAGYSAKYLPRAEGAANQGERGRDRNYLR